MTGGLQLIVFDLIGTTIQDHQEVPDTFSEALAEYDIRITAEQMRHVRGASKREALQQLIEPSSQQAEIAESVYALFREKLKRKFTANPARPIEGANDIFRWFRERGVRIVLNTGFDREITDLVISFAGWENGAVDAVVCVEDVSKGRPAPFLIFHAMEVSGISSVHEVANVGDTAIDLFAGHNAGIRWNIGVLSGGHSRAMLETAPHTHLLTSIAELPTVFQDLY